MTAKATASKKKHDFTRPDKILTPEEYIAMPLADLEALAVDCASCPVNMSCMTQSSYDGEGGSVCKTCNAVGVVLSNKNNGDAHLAIVDCTKHQFKKNKEIETCELCDGKVTKFAMIRQGTTHANRYVLPTQYQKVTLKDRQKMFTKQHAHWKDQVRQRDEAVAAEAAKRANELKKAAETQKEK